MEIKVTSARSLKLDADLSSASEGGFTFTSRPFLFTFLVCFGVEANGERAFIRIEIKVFNFTRNVKYFVLFFRFNWHRQCV